MFNPGDIVCVLLPNAVNNGYDYRLTAPAHVGNFVRVSVMNRPYVGVIVGPGISGLAPTKIKTVQQVFTATDFNSERNPGLSKDDIDWIYKMADWTMMAPGAVLRLVLNIPDAFTPPKTEPAFAYAPDALTKMTPARWAIADAFDSCENEPMTVSDIQNIAHVSLAVIKGMIKNETLVPVAQVAQKNKSSESEIKYFDTKNVTLNTEQKSAADAIDISKFGVHLLDGITGSGKTQVYFDAAMRAYASGKSVIILMPEIALTAQFMNRFKDKFGAPPTVWHSAIPAARRREIWRGVASGRIRIIVGTRSALFLPYKDLGLIVVDEEHDTSYKQEDMGNYHARDMAILRGKISGFPIILASATPSLETFKNVADGAFTASVLQSRFGGAIMPKIELIDMRKESIDKNQKSFISPTLSNAITETLAAGQQVMLFINRRGFAPFVQCKQCGWHADCPDCSVGMVYHKDLKNIHHDTISGPALMCHVCGKTATMPLSCPECGSGDVSLSGAGVEKIQAEVSEKWPGVKNEIVSSDTMTSRQALERLVKNMENGETKIIIGTQILAKGHHFPNLTLVGVIDADMGLFGTDFRSGERTFQQLFQVAGRAGRGEIPGRVMLQTYQPDNPVLSAIAAYDRDKLMMLDLDGRRAAGLPPYGQLIAIIVESNKEDALRKFCANLSDNAPTAPGIKVFGPVPAQIYQIRNWFRMRFLVSAAGRVKIQPFVAHWLSKVKQPANIKLKIDVNPQNFM